MPYENASLLFEWPAFTEPANGAVSHSVARYADSGNLRQQTADHQSGGQSVVVSGGQWTRWIRDIAPDGSIVPDSVQSQLCESLSGSTNLLVRHVRNSYSLQGGQRQAAGTGAGVSCWYVNGIIANAPIAPFWGTDHYSSFGAESLYVPGYGVYTFQPGNTGAAHNSSGVGYYPVGLGGSPTSAAQSGLHIDNVGVTSGARRFAGWDRHGNIYIIRGVGSFPVVYRLLKVAAGLGEVIYDVTLPASMPDVPLPGNTVWSSLGFEVIGDGSLLLGVRGEVGVGNYVQVYDLADPENLVRLGEVFIADGGVSSAAAVPLQSLDSCAVWFPNSFARSVWRIGDCAREFDCDNVGVDQIVYDLARRAGLPAGRIDVSGIELTEDYGRIAGFGIGRSASARTMIEILQRHSFFDVTEIGGIVAARRRDREPDGVIGGDDLRAHAYGETPPTLAARERIEDYEIPAEVRVEYSQLDAEYEAGVEAYTRRVTDAAGVLDVDLSSIAMEPDEAAVIAEATLLEAIIARESIETHLVATDANKALKPGDIKVLQVGDRQDVVRITDIRYAYPGVMQLKMLRHDPSVYSSDARGAGRSTPGSVIVQHGPTTYELLDAPLVRDFDDVPGYFAALGGIPTIPGVIEGWPGGDLSREEPGGRVDILRMFRPGAIFGETLTALPEALHTIVDWSEVEVTVSGPLVSATLQQALTGRNLAAVEVREGGERIGWELVRFLEASYDEEDGWAISGLIRGVNGTEWAIGMHQPGDRLVVLDGVDQVITDIASELNILRSHNAATIGRELLPETAVDFAWRGVDRIPWAPCQLSAERDGGSVWIRWRRRDRVGMELQNGVETPLSEDAEEYVLTIFNAAGNEVVRSATLTSSEYEYLAADELADHGAAQATLRVAVAQIGILGPGYAATGVVDVAGDQATPPALPPGDESRVTLTVGGAFSADDTLYFRLVYAETGVGTHQRLYAAEGSGKAAVEDYLTDLEAQVLADFPGLSTYITGNELVISTTAGVLTGTVTNNTADQILTLAQEAAPATVVENYRYIGTLDFYEMFGGFDVVGPSISTKYGSGTSMTARLQVVGVTYDAAKALGPGNLAQFNVLSTQDGPDTAMMWTFPLDPSLDAIRDNASFMEFVDGTGLGTFTSGLTWPQPRAGVHITMKANYRLAQQFWATSPINTNVQLQPLKYLVKTNRQAQPHFPSGAQQIILVGWLTSIDPATPQSVVEGQVYKISLGGVDFSRTVTSGDAADPFRESILQALVDDIDADPDYEVDVFTANRAPEDPLAPGTWITRIEIRHTDPNTPFTFEASASFGIEATVVNEIVPE